MYDSWIHDHPGFDAETALDWNVNSGLFVKPWRQHQALSTCCHVTMYHELPMYRRPACLGCPSLKFDLLGSFSPASVSSNPALLSVSQCWPEKPCLIFIQAQDRTPRAKMDTALTIRSRVKWECMRVEWKSTTGFRFLIVFQLFGAWDSSWNLVKHVMSDLARTEVSPHATSVNCISCLAILTRAGLCFDTASCDILLEMLQPQHSWCFWPKASCFPTDLLPFFCFQSAWLSKTSPHKSPKHCELETARELPWNSKFQDCPSYFTWLCSAEIHTLTRIFVMYTLLTVYKCI